MNSNSIAIITNHTLKHRLLPVLLLFSALACSPAPVTTQWQGKIMGTFYQVKLVTDEALPAEAETDIVAVMERTNSLMSNWKADSEISRFNAHQDSTPFLVSEETTAVLGAAFTLHKQTGGALDPTLSPLIQLWGFGTDKRVTFPEEAAIQAALTRCGMDKLKLADNALTKSLPELTVNLSAIAKGFAVDQVSQRLERMGVTRYLVNIGGEVRVRGNNPQGKPWRMAVEKPNYSKGQEVYGVFHLGEMAMATSGDYRIYFEHEGKQYSHIIDPRNGYPVARGIASASVIAPDCMTADGLATALLVLPPEEGVRMIQAIPNVECLILVRDEQGGYTSFESTGLDAYRLQ